MNEIIWVLKFLKISFRVYLQRHQDNTFDSFGSIWRISINIQEDIDWMVPKTHQPPKTPYHWLLVGNNANVWSTSTGIKKDLFRSANIHYQSFRAKKITAFERRLLCLSSGNSSPSWRRITCKSSVRNVSCPQNNPQIHHWCGCWETDIKDGKPDNYLSQVSTRREPILQHAIGKTKTYVSSACVESGHWSWTLMFQTSTTHYGQLVMDLYFETSYFFSV